ncbi:LysM and BON domain-containing protein [Caulobacter sp. 17J80-11]|uniref:LysM and BON domain-containing protein n=1 Tax=Caulobacter sp. 17J80-11 TaxID=2763502 RepID=UPI001653DAF7|nr:LysM and BON domain-containing protein [Caulobacter sp. 17J80-11]MBC6981050.1 LysM and BON domain-containing protein [Caulobacter sp. 17J80-11]
MGLFNFARDAGESLRHAIGMGGPDEKDLTQALQKHGVTLQNLDLKVKGETVTIKGIADSQSEREKAILIVGNVKGVEKVDDDIRIAAPTAAQVRTAVPQTNPQAGAAAAPPPRIEPESQFYTVKPGDTLSAIAQQFYGSANKYQAIFEANRPMLSDPNKIYPGQALRIPVQH